MVRCACRSQRRSVADGLRLNPSMRHRKVWHMCRCSCKGCRPDCVLRAQAIHLPSPAHGTRCRLRPWSLAIKRRFDNNASTRLIMTYTHPFCVYRLAASAGTRGSTPRRSSQQTARRLRTASGHRPPRAVSQRLALGQPGPTRCHSSGSRNSRAREQGACRQLRLAPPMSQRTLPSCQRRRLTLLCGNGYRTLKLRLNLGMCRREKLGLGTLGPQHQNPLLP